MAPATRSPSSSSRSDSEGEREHGAARALSGATREHHRQRRGQPAHERAQRQRGQDDSKHAVLPVDVAHPAEHRGEHSGGQQVHGQDPRAARRTGTQCAVDVGQGGHDGGLQDREDSAGQREDGHHSDHDDGCS